MEWVVEGTDEFADWYGALTEAQRELVNAAVDQLETHGPSLGRPFVGEVTGSNIHNLKELRPRPGNLRILFAFDPRRAAILLLGGDKTGEWNQWYQRAIPEAERLYEEYLEELRREGVLM